MTGRFKIVAVDAHGICRDVARAGTAPGDADWIVFADPRAVLHPELAELLRIHGANRPDVDMFYGDEVIAAALGQPARYLCKPSFDRTQLMAQDYVGLPFAVRARAMATLGSPDAKAGSAQCYDLLLRAMAEEIGIDRITEVLAVNPADRFQATVADRLAALRRILPRLSPGCQAVQGMIESSLEIRREFEVFPDLTLVIPTSQRRRPGEDARPSRNPMILDLLEGICRSDWPMDRLNVLIGDDIEDGSIYESRAWPFRLDRVVTGRGASGEFNYAWKLNTLLRLVGTEHLIVLNDDLLTRQPGWIKALMTFAVDEGVGGVGARLLYPNGRIQHAGMAAGVLGHCTHVFIGALASDPTYQNWAAVQREWSIVTGAVFATRRSLLVQVNGFDERFALDFNDVDLCLRLRQLGYRIIFTPHAELTHFESASRGKTATTPELLSLFVQKWQDYLKDDPAYHPNLTRTTPDIQPVIPARAWWKEIAGAADEGGASHRCQNAV